MWKNYNANIITSSVDPTLHGKFTAEEASNALQAGLLCTQSSDTLRPSMSEVVQMLTKKDYVIPSPNQQPFLVLASIPNKSSYRLSPQETKEIQRQVDEFLQKGFLRGSLSPCPVILVPKKDGT